MKKLYDTMPGRRTWVRLVLLLAVLCTFGILTARSGAAPTVTITIVNNSSWEIRHLYLSPANNDNWGPDQLNNSPIGAGATRELNVSWDQSTVKLVAEDQDGCFLSTTVATSGSPTWTITSQSARNCGN
jgi:hypothetical protein